MAMMALFWRDSGFVAEGPSRFSRAPLCAALKYFDISNLKYVRHFYRLYAHRQIGPQADDQIGQQVADQLQNVPQVGEQLGADAYLPYWKAVVVGPCACLVATEVAQKRA